jgi:hypothetical protein
MSLAERFADDISLEYSLIDRMRVRGHVLKLQTITMLRTYFQQVRHVDWIEPQDLQRATDEFVRFVEDYARLHDIPLVPAQPKESHVDKAAEYLDRVADQERAVYCIIKVQEETSSFVSYVPKTGDDKERKIARGRRRINHYYFFLKDPEFGVGNSIRISSYAPFPVTVCFNGHHFVAQYLRSRGVGFQMCDNMIVAVDDPKAFRRAIRALTPRAIERFCDDWVYQLTVWFPPRAKRQGFRYRWFLDQVEYSHNLIFREKDKLNALFGRLLDRGRQIAQPHVIARLFHRQRLRTQRTGGRVQRTREEDYVLKAWHKKTNIKQYNKQQAAVPQAGLRTETTSYDVREFGTKKGLRNLPYLLRCMKNCNQRLLRWEDSIDQTTVSARYLEKLGQPTVRENGQRVPGLNVHHPRLYRVLAAVLQFAHLITGFRNRELREYLQRRFGLSPDEYTAAQLRYDLLKLRAKGWIRKLEGKALYVLTPKGMAQATTLAKLNECLNGTLGHPPSAIPKISSPQTEIQKRYRRVRQQLQKLLQVWGIAT